MTEKWILRKRPFSQFLERLPISSVLAKIMSNRIPETEAEAYYHRDGMRLYKSEEAHKRLFCVLRLVVLLLVSTVSRISASVFFLGNGE